MRLSCGRFGCQGHEADRSQVTFSPWVWNVESLLGHMRRYDPALGLVTLLKDLDAMERDGSALRVGQDAWRLPDQPVMRELAP